MAKKSGLDQLLDLSEELSDFMGKDRASRKVITQELWKHIKKHKLNEGRTIHPDETLSPILGKKSLTMFEIPKKISAHVTKIDD